MTRATKHSPLGVAPRSPWPPLQRNILIAALLCLTAAGCGASPRPSPSTRAEARPGPEPALRVCKSASHTAARLLAVPIKANISDSNPTDIECVVSGAGINVEVVSQASSGAWMLFDAVTSHQAQAYGSGAVDEPAEMPHLLANFQFEEAWIPAQDEMVATNGTQTRGGSYVTVTVTRAGRRSSTRHPSTMELANAITHATIASAPRGSKPGPPPS